MLHQGLQCLASKELQILCRFSSVPRVGHWYNLQLFPPPFRVCVSAERVSSSAVVTCLSTLPRFPKAVGTGMGACLSACFDSNTLLLGVSACVFH